MRRLRYVVIESGRCQHCGKDAGDHSTEGLCGPQAESHQRFADAPEPCYRGQQAYAFIDLDSDEARAWAVQVARSAA